MKEGNLLDKVREMLTLCSSIYHSILNDEGIETDLKWVHWCFTGGSRLEIV
jgi:hypothetical protein